MHRTPNARGGTILRVAHRGLGLDSEHPRDGEAVDVSVENGHVPPGAGQRDGEVDGHGGLADPALTGADADHPGATLWSERVGPALLVPDGLLLVLMTGGGAIARRARPRLGVPGRLASTRRQLGPHGVQLGRAHDRHLDAHLLDAAQRCHRLGDPAGDLGTERAARHGQRHGDGHPPSPDVDTPDHVQLDDAQMQLGVGHRAQSLDDLQLRQRHGSPSGGRSDTGTGAGSGRPICTTSIGRIPLWRLQPITGGPIGPVCPDHTRAPPRPPRRWLPRRWLPRPPPHRPPPHRPPAPRPPPPRPSPVARCWPPGRPEQPGRRWPRDQR